MKTRCGFVLFLLGLALTGCGTPDCGFAEAERVGLRVCAFDAEAATITLVNFDSTERSLQGHDLWNAENFRLLQNAKSLDAMAPLAAGATLIVKDLPFALAASGETVTLTDATGKVVHQRSQ